LLRRLLLRGPLARSPPLRAGLPAGPLLRGRLRLRAHLRARLRGVEALVDAGHSIHLRERRGERVVRPLAAHADAALLELGEALVDARRATPVGEDGQR